MSKEIYISSTPHETRLAIVEDDQVAEVYYERENEYTLAGSIYKGRVTRVLPGMQSAFVDVGLERDAFLYVTDFLEEQEDSADFERIPNGNGQSPARETREQRPATQLSSEPVRTGEGHNAPSSADSESGANRRLRGRRGRRRGRGNDRGQQSPRQESSSQAQTSPQSLEIERETEPFTEYESPREQQHEPRSESGSEPRFESRREQSREQRSEPRYESRQESRRTAPPATGFILPGESLSKYGGTPASPSSAQQSASPSQPVRNATTSRPSTLVEVPLTWDGGITLPGESLSRHRNRPVDRAIEPTTRHASEGSQAAENSLSADSAEAPSPSTPEEAAIEFAAEVAVASGADQATLAVPQAEAEPEHAHEASPAAEHEHELSASHQINPIAPVEFRSRWTEDVAEAEPPAHEPQSAHQPEPVHEIPPAPAPAHPGVFQRLKHIASELFESHPEHQAPPPPADTTTIQPTGQMESHPADHNHEAEHETAETAATTEPLHSPASGVFAPGEGHVEEEIIDEEEYDYEPLASHSDEPEFDELEEETRVSMDGGDLGDMLRDAQIEHETRYLSDDPEETTQGDVFDEDIDAFEAEPHGEDEAVATEAEGAPARPAERRPRRGGDRRFGRGGQRGGPRGRRSAQTTSLPIISELLKQGQEILVQIAKEPIARKGARITSHIALPGRYLVFMPTVNHVGVSRKISSDEERRRLKHVLLSEKGDAPGGFIVRTAAGTATEDELRADIRFLINLWTDVKQRADAGKAPALIYHDLSLVERILRDQVTESFSSIWVDTEADYERVLRFLQRFQPAMVRRVKLYTKETPLFEQFGIQDEINKALKSKVWLKSGGSIVINQTEALVAIDINTGKYVGKTARLEDTIIKTNLDAIPEIVRQIRLRDLGGIIVIDFIDMDERKNRHRVMQALEEALKADRAPSKVLQFNDFGLVAITRKRVKQSLERTLSTQCTVCTGTGMVKSPVTVCNEIYVEMRKMNRHLEGKDVLLRVHPEVVKQLKSSNGKWLNELEEVAGKTIILKSDPALQPEQFDIH